ncbi:immunity protein TriTu family protein [Andreprevotia chitinilytica]|uniref:immunity protein TriTu family protein n=1 Tax=Andreprevotia chitinilytica TaxID=396808 RepID=UPI0005569C29|nr:hypothetical protein [Andreprevotia chitinilytica]
MLTLFLEWVYTRAAEQMPAAEMYVTFCAETDNRAARLDLDTPTAVARITCWDSGDYFAEILEFETAKHVYTSHGQLVPDECLSERFQDFFVALGG